MGPTINYLKKAGIKLWVLTGDKVETAINIGFSTQVLDNSLKLLEISGKNPSKNPTPIFNKLTPVIATLKFEESIALKELDDFYEVYGKQKAPLESALIVTGNALQVI